MGKNTDLTTFQTPRVPHMWHSVTHLSDSLCHMCTTECRTSVLRFCCVFLMILEMKTKKTKVKLLFDLCFFILIYVIVFLENYKRNAVDLL